MTAAMQQLDLSYQLAMYASTAIGMLVIGLIVGGLVVLVQSLFRGLHHGEKPHDR